MATQFYGLEGVLGRIVMFAFTVVVYGTDTRSYWSNGYELDTAAYRRRANRKMGRAHFLQSRRR
jgi:hypothetical protein